MSCIETITICVYEDTITLMIEEHKKNKEFSALLESANDSLSEAKKCVKKLQNAIDEAIFEKEIHQNLVEHCTPGLSYKIKSHNGQGDKKVVFKNEFWEHGISSHKAYDCEKEDVEKLVDSAECHREELRLREQKQNDNNETQFNGLQCKPCWVLLERLTDDLSLKCTQFRPYFKVPSGSTEKLQEGNRQSVPPWRRMRKFKGNLIPHGT